MKTIIFDIDGTLANISNRVGRIPNWKYFQTDHHLDKPIEAIVTLFHTLYNTCLFRLICVSGRLESEREATTEWLTGHGIYYEQLIMRPDGNYISDDVLKEKVLKRLQAEGHDILFVVDDRKRVVDMWRRNNIMCLQCAEGDY